MFTIISFFQKLIKGGVGIRAGGLENFSKINKRGGTIIRYSRVVKEKYKNKKGFLLSSLRFYDASSLRSVGSTNQAILFIYSIDF